MTKLSCMAARVIALFISVLLVSATGCTSSLEWSFYNHYTECLSSNIAKDTEEELKPTFCTLFAGAKLDDELGPGKVAMLSERGLFVVNMEIYEECMKKTRHQIYEKRAVLRCYSESVTPQQDFSKSDIFKEKFGGDYTFTYENGILIEECVRFEDGWDCKSYI